jgi:hypothetical protein
VDGREHQRRLTARVARVDSGADAAGQRAAAAVDGGGARGVLGTAQEAAQRGLVGSLGGRVQQALVEGQQAARAQQLGLLCALALELRRRGATGFERGLRECVCHRKGRTPRGTPAKGIALALSA